MSGLEARGAAIGAAAADAAAARLAERLRAALPGARVSRAGDAVIVEGRGLATREAWRWPAGVLR